MDLRALTGSAYSFLAKVAIAEYVRSAGAILFYPEVKKEKIGRRNISGTKYQRLSLGFSTTKIVKCYTNHI